MSQLSPRSSTSRLPAQRSPWRRAGGSSAPPNRARRTGSASRSRPAMAVVERAVAFRARRASGRQPLRAVELGPRRQRFVRQAPAARGAPVLATEARGRGQVQPRQRPAEVGLGGRDGAARRRPTRGRGTEGRRHRRRRRRAPSGTRDGVGGREPAQPRGLRAEEPGRRIGMRLGEDGPTVRELHAEGLGDISAAYDRLRRHVVLEGTCHGRSKGVHERRVGRRRRGLARAAVIRPHYGGSGGQHVQVCDLQSR